VLLFKKSSDVIFTQPILITQNLFNSVLLNKWSGNKVEIGNDNIMAPMFGAGTKNASNEFSGVLMGDISIAIPDQGFQTKTGLFGYQKNNLNFQLTTDGILKLGNNTSGGQIVFDGTNGTIVSNNYITKNGQEGMKIDLGNGHIDAYNFKLKSGKILIDSNATNGDYFSITDSGYGKIFSVSSGNKAGI
jgi:hypothetical protein